jgi:hypothetical protein
MRGPEQAPSSADSTVALVVAVSLILLAWSLGEILRSL